MNVSDLEKLQQGKVNLCKTKTKVTPFIRGTMSTQGKAPRVGASSTMSVAPVKAEPKPGALQLWNQSRTPTATRPVSVKKEPQWLQAVKTENTSSVQPRIKAETKENRIKQEPL